MQFVSRGRVRAGVFALLGLASLTIAPAAQATPQATPNQEWVLSGLVFSDGGTGTATISFGFYGYFDASRSGAVTTAGTVLTGYTYDQNAFKLVGPQISPDGKTLTFLDGAYAIGLQLTFVNPITNNGNFDPLVTGINGPSFEFTGFGSTKRYLTSGDVQAPEPGTLPLFAVALAGLAVFGARRRGGLSVG